MSDLEEWLRTSMADAVADAEPPNELMELVRRRHRRRGARLRSAAAAIAVLLVAAFVMARAWPAGAPHQAGGGTSHARLFPGGGRLLSVTARGLAWFYPDGRRAVIAPWFRGAGAGAGIYGDRLLAWRTPGPCGSPCFSDVSYYSMNLDGSDARLVLPAEHEVGGAGFYHFQVQLSPDGAMLGYVRTEEFPGGRNGTGELWTINLATHQRSDLGPLPGSFVWQNNTTLLAGPVRAGRTLELINARTGTRTRYLSVSDPAIVRAYERVRPGAGAPATIGVIDWSPGRRPALAISVAIWRHGTYSMPAVEVLAGSRVVAFAPNDHLAQILVFGPRGGFLLATGEGDNPASWLNGTFVGSISRWRLWRQPTFGEPFDSAFFSPDGSVIAFWYNGGPLAFVPLTKPACAQAGIGPCPNFTPRPVFGLGTPQAWEP